MDNHYSREKEALLIQHLINTIASIVSSSLHIGQSMVKRENKIMIKDLNALNTSGENPANLGNQKFGYQLKIHTFSTLDVNDFTKTDRKYVYGRIFQ